MRLRSVGELEMRRRCMAVHAMRETQVGDGRAVAAGDSIGGLMTAPNEQQNRMIDELSVFITKWCEILDGLQVLRALSTAIGTMVGVVSQRTGNDRTNVGARVSRNVLQVVADEMNEEDARAEMN